MGLMLATYYGNDAVVRTLLAASVDVERYGTIALPIAALLVHVQMHATLRGSSQGRYAIFFMLGMLILLKARGLSKRQPRRRGRQGDGDSTAGTA